MKYAAILLFVGACSIPSLFAQQAEIVQPSKNSLQDQYKNLKTDLEVINGFRMIKMYTMDRFWNVVMDSLKAEQVKSAQATSTITARQKDITGLLSTIKKLESEKQELVTRVDNLIVFGKPLAKAGVVSVASFVFLGLIALCVILFVVSRTSYNTSRELRKLNESMYQEFDTYKRHAVEKEIKLSRELQNHRNKLAELKVL